MQSVAVSGRTRWCVLMNDSILQCVAVSGETR